MSIRKVKHWTTLLKRNVALASLKIKENKPASVCIGWAVVHLIGPWMMAQLIPKPGLVRREERPSKGCIESTSLKMKESISLKRITPQRI